MRVKEIINKNAVVCTEDTSLEKVFELMTENGCNCVAVVESNRHRSPIGIITEHDICRQLIGKNRNPRGMRAANVMNTNISKANGDLSLNECLHLIQIKSAERILIIDDDGILCGSLTKAEIEKSLENKSPNNRKIMNDAPFYSYNSPGINRIF